MAIRSIVMVPNPALSQKAKEVKNIDSCVRELACDLAETMYSVPGVGLAANQVGELLRLIVVDVLYPYAEPHERKKDPLCIINPVISMCEGSSLKEEGCLSVPEFALEVKRWESVRVTGFDVDGKPLDIAAEGLLARVIQHEVDHLDGKTLLDRASSLKRNLYKKRLKKQERKEG